MDFEQNKFGTKMQATQEDDIYETMSPVRVLSTGIARYVIKPCKALPLDLCLKR